MDTPIFEIRSLSVSFQERSGIIAVLKDVSLSFFSGKITAVIGASGSGKSVLAHALFGILPRSAKIQGSFFYQGQLLSSQQLEVLRGRELVLVPQSLTSLDPLRKVQAQLCDGVSLGPEKKHALDVLKRYGLENVENRYPFQLSGGMARRVLISTAVMGTPRFVVADEPTPGLDDRSARWVLRHFQEIAAEGTAVLLITHDLSLALTVADRVAVFYGGMLLEEGAAADFSSPKYLRHPYTKALWNAMPQNGFSTSFGAQSHSYFGGCPCIASCPLAKADCQASVPLTSLRGGLVRCRHAV